MTTPETNFSPRHPLAWLTAFALATVFWGTTVGVVVMVKNNQDEARRAHAQHSAQAPIAPPRR